MDESGCSAGQLFTTEALRSGSAIAFRSFYESHWRSMFVWTSRILQNEEDAKDLVADSFIKFWENRGRLNDRYPPHFYLYRILRNNLINSIERKRSLVARLAVLKDTAGRSDPFQPGDGLSLLEEKELRLELEKAIESLPARMQQIFRMSRHRHMSIPEISATLHLSSQTVKNQLTSALKLLKTRLHSVIHFFF